MWLLILGGESMVRRHQGGAAVFRGAPCRVPGVFLDRTRGGDCCLVCESNSVADAAGWVLLEVKRVLLCEPVRVGREASQWALRRLVRNCAGGENISGASAEGPVPPGGRPGGVWGSVARRANRFRPSAAVA